MGPRSRRSRYLDRLAVKRRELDERRRGRIIVNRMKLKYGVGDGSIPDDAALVPRNLADNEGRIAAPSDAKIATAAGYPGKKISSEGDCPHNRVESGK